MAIMELADNNTSEHHTLEESLVEQHRNAEHESRRLYRRANDFEEESSQLTRKASNELHEAKRLDKEAKRLDKEAKRLDKEAKRLDTKAKRLDTKAKRLSEASRRDRTDAREEENRANSLAYEIALLCASRNDLNTVKVDATDFPIGYGKRLGEALLRNTVVTELDLDLAFMVASNLQGLAGAETETAEDIQSLVQFLGESPSLVNLAVGVDKVRGSAREAHTRRPDVVAMANVILAATSSCNTLEKLTWQAKTLPDAFRDMMALPTLQELKLVFLNIPYSLDEQQMIASAFGSNKVLRRLNVAVEGNVDLYRQIVSRLHHMGSLQDLAVTYDRSCDETFYAALVQCLRSVGTLQRFTMEGFPMNNEILPRILSSLQQRSDAEIPSISLRALCFDLCHFDCYDESIDLLMALLETKTIDSNGTIVFSSCLRELRVFLYYNNRDFPSDQMAHALLMASEQGIDPGLPNRLVPTIGSQVHTFSYDFPTLEFFKCWSHNAHKVRVQDLELDILDIDLCIAFAECVPKLRTIRKLKVAVVDSVFWFLTGLKHNGSICEAEVISYTDIDKVGQFDFDDETQLQLIQAYCDRNKYLGNLLVNRSDSDSIGEMVAPVKTELFLYPQLFEVTKQLTHTGVTMIMESLMMHGKGDEFEHFSD